MLDRETYFHNDLKNTVDSVKSSNHNDLASIDSKVGDLAGFKTQNHTDLDVLNTSFTQLANWLKKKLAYSPCYDFVSKVVDLTGQGDFTLSELDVGKSYLLQLNVTIGVDGTLNVYLPVGDYIIGSEFHESVGGKVPYDFSAFYMNKMVASKSGDLHRVTWFDSSDVGEVYYIFIQRCSDSPQW